MNATRRNRIALCAVLGLLMVLPALGAESATKSRPQAQAPSLPPGSQSLLDIPYVENGSPAQRLDLFLPPKTDKPAPLLLWVHGGGWVGGSKSGAPAGALLARGYAVASVEYRFSQEALYPAQIQDCKAALRFLRANAQKYNLDPQRVGAWGASAGGHLVALLGTTGGVSELEGPGGNADHSSRVTCVVDYCGPTDFLNIVQQAYAQKIKLAEQTENLVNRLFGDKPGAKPELARLASPALLAGKDAVAFLIVHGEADEIVPPDQARELDAALKKAGAESTLLMFPGIGHGVGAAPGLNNQVTKFLDTHLKP